MGTTYRIDRDGSRLFLRRRVGDPAGQPDISSDPLTIEEATALGNAILFRAQEAAAAKRDEDRKGLTALKEGIERHKREIAKLEQRIASIEGEPKSETSHA